jgi:hypothetical protein
MARIFDDITNDTPQNVYAGAPIQEIKALNASASDQYNQSRTAKDALDVMAANLDLRDVDYQVKKRVIDETKAKFKDLTSRGDYQNAQYLIQDVTKTLATDQELQGAIQSRQKELAYYKGLKDQLDKGEISQDIYNYGVAQSREANINPVRYDPATMTSKGIFTGQNISKDLSKEIYDNMNNRIKDWQPESITTINGKQFKKTSASPTGYFDITTGKEVKEDEVYNALRTELENTGEYKDFLNQEKAIDFRKQFRQADGTVRSIDRSDVGKLGLSDNKIKTLISGISENTLNDLSKSKDKKSQEEYKKYSDLRNSVNVDNLSQEQLNKLYNYAYSQQQSDKYVKPATAKAEYQLFEDKYLEDSFGLENLKFQHKLSEDKAKAELSSAGVRAAPENVSQLQQYRYSDILATQQSLADVNKELSQISTQLPNATEATRKELLQREQILRNKAQLLKRNQNSLENSMDQKGYDTTKDYAAYLETSSDKSLTNELFSRVLNLPANKIDTDLAANISVMKNNLNNPGRDPSTTMDYIDVIRAIKSNPETKAILEDVKSKIADKLATVPERTVWDKINFGGLGAGSGKTDLEKLQILKENLNSTKEKYLEKEKTKSIATQFIAIDENNNNKESDSGKTSNKVIRETNDLVGSLVRNPSSELTTESGIPLYEIGSGEKEGYKFIDKAGKSAKPDLTKTKVNISSQTVGGKVPIGVTLFDTDGNALYFDDEQKGQATILVYPKNDEVTLGSLRNIGRDYIRNGKDNSTKMKGIQYMANSEYKSQLDNQIAPDFWDDKPKGYSEDVTLNIKGQPVQIKFVKENTGNGQTEFSISPINGDPKTFYNVDGKPIKTFKSLEQAATVLFYNENYKEDILPYMK